MVEEEKQVQAEEQEQVETPETEEKVPEWEKKEAKYKDEIGGLNRKISQLEKKFTDQEREKLTELEREKAELEDLRQEKEAAKTEAENLRRDRLVDKELFTANLPADVFGGRIIGKTEDEIKEDVQNLTGHIDKIVNDRVEAEINKRLKGQTPGKQPDGETKITQADAVKRALELSRGMNVYRG